MSGLLLQAAIRIDACDGKAQNVMPWQRTCTAKMSGAKKRLLTLFLAFL